MLEPVKLTGTTDSSGDLTLTSEGTYNGRAALRAMD
jgi:hypothetical protein